MTDNQNMSKTAMKHVQQHFLFKTSRRVTKNVSENLFFFVFVWLFFYPAWRLNR